MVAPVMPEFLLYYLDVHCTHAVLENDPISDDEPTMQGEEL